MGATSPAGAGAMAAAAAAAADGIADPKRVKRLVAINFAVKIFFFLFTIKKSNIYP
jgi:hypothetical protein